MRVEYEQLYYHQYVADMNDTRWKYSFCGTLQKLINDLSSGVTTDNFE